MIKLWNGSQISLLEQLNSLLRENKLPQEVVNSAREMINILDENYGADRHPEEDLGGCLYILENEIISESNEYLNLLDKYYSSADMAEYTDCIGDYEEELTGVKYQWWLQMFIISADYGVIIIYKDLKEK